MTHSYLPRPPSDSALLVEESANVLGHTGSFISTEQSLEFVRVTALEGIESIARLSQHLVSVFRAEVTSSDMTLLFATPGAGFDDVGMTNELGSGGRSTPGRRDRVAGTTEVGVGKSVCGGPGESRRAEILLKTKVVLEKDIVEGRG